MYHQVTAAVTSHSTAAKPARSWMSGLVIDRGNRNGSDHFLGTCGEDGLPASRATCQRQARPNRVRSVYRQASTQIEQPPLEKPPFRLLSREFERPVVGGLGFLGASKPATQIGAGGVRQVVVAQIAAGEDGVD